ncbi:MAG: DoxX family protein [Candidatus Woesearchaeota archaeon]
MISKYAKKTENIMYLIFRIILGFLFAMHGATKIGLIGKTPMTGLMLIVGIGEILVGLGILLGFLVRHAAIGGAIIMIGAWIKVHLPNGINPMANQGELSLLFLIAFLIVFAMGPGNFSLEKALFKKELC